MSLPEKPRVRRGSVSSLVAECRDGHRKAQATPSNGALGPTERPAAMVQLDAHGGVQLD